MDRFTRSTWGIPLALLLTLACGMCLPASAKVVYVNKNATGTVHDGASWATAYTSVQPAINAAASGDEVWVAQGNYSASLSVTSSIRLYGGFSGVESLLVQRDPSARVTALDGNGQFATLIIPSNVTGTVVDGFTIQHGLEYGIDCSGAQTVISNNIITGNGGYTTVFQISIDRSEVLTTACGVVLRATATGSRIVGNSVTGNKAHVEVDSAHGLGVASAVGVQVGATDVVIDRCKFSENQATSMSSPNPHYASAGGYAVRANGDATAITNCLITGNSGGISASGSGVIVANNTITNNGGGGGYSPASVYVSTTGTFANNIVYGNYVGVDAEGAITHNCVFANTDSDYTTARSPHPTDVSANPLFRNRAIGDFRLLPGSPCIDSGDDSIVSPGDTDLDGNPRISGPHVDMGAYELHQAPRAWSVSLGTTVTGGVTVADNVAYVAGNDGKLYARRTTDGTPVPGFPVDINAAVGATVKLSSRPAVYYGKTGKAIYLTTDRGDVVRILPDGSVAWHVRPLTGQTVSTPAVTPDGYVYVNLSTGSGAFDNFVFKLDEATGTPVSLSPFLGYTTADNIGDFSPAANNRYLYVNSGWGSKSGLTLLNQDNLAVRSSFAGGEQCLSPLLLGRDLLLASKGGKAWKMNAVTLAPDLGFGHFGVANLGAQISAAPFSDGAGNVYIGTADGRILKWVPGSGSFTPFYTATGKIAGLTIDRAAGVLGFGTSAGSFVQVPLSQPTSASTVTPGGAISTGTVYESLTDRFIVVTDDGVLSGYPAIR